MKNPFKRKKRFNLKFYIDKCKTFLLAVIGFIVSLYDRLSGKVKRRRVIAKLRLGDIILASPGTLRLSPIALVYRLMLRSKYVHSMLYVGDSKIIHTTSKHGVRLDRLPRKIYQKDRYAIYRVKSLDSEQRQRLKTEALKFKDKKLDHAGLITNVPAKFLGLGKPLLSFEKNRLWCSKLIYKVYSANDIELVPSEKGESITSEDLSKSTVLTKI